MKKTKTMDTKNSTQRNKSAAQKFLKNEDGNLILFSFFMFIIMVFTSGMAVDIARHESRRVTLQNVTDSATLAATRVARGDTFTEIDVVKSWFAVAGFDGVVSDDQIQVLEKVVERDADGNVIGVSSRSVQVQAQLEVPTAFMTWLNVDMMVAPSASTAKETTQDIEISLVLDISGSMAGDKIIALQKAAAGDRNDADGVDTGFIEIMLADNPTTQAEINNGLPLTTISLIPYSQSVNAGAALFNQYNVQDGTAPDDESRKHNYSHCANFTDQQMTQVSLKPNTSVADPASTNDNPLPNLPVTGDLIIQQSFFSTNTSGDPQPISGGIVCNYAGKNQIIPVSMNEAALRTAIYGYTAGGWTATDHGAKWGVALLDPDTQPTITALQSFQNGPELIDNNRNTPRIGYKYSNSVLFNPNRKISPQAVSPWISNRPAPYQNSDTKKVLVIMSDGANTRQYELKTALDNLNSEYLPNGIKGQMSPVFYRTRPNPNGGRYSVLVEGDFDLGAYTEYLDDNAANLLTDEGIDVTNMNDRQVEDTIQLWLDSDPDDPFSQRPRFYHEDDERYARHIDQSRGDHNPNNMDIIQLSWAELYVNYNTRKVAEKFFRDARDDDYLTNADYNMIRTPYKENHSGTLADARLKNICNAAKATRNIQIYTVGFQIDASSTEEVLLQDCASNDSGGNSKLYFPATNASELQSAFRRIAENIKQLRLTQ
ncbi:TadE/TadG family type IV pilus assembly protein [Parasulfitobacter algicola]|uniref:Putative Flp pilus-assembly TadG-like N-terminal domain-containing protein n=1 Tax=Parasulfitobacter algicola TaxID=2614809 RepID=A0ABX2IM11_9RHOB|nr:Tad domain-containing protein [Sulfitobacter algicola]NSX53907.1 hypothetical protein [Sulfitobacter algicola]